MIKCLSKCKYIYYNNEFPKEPKDKIFIISGLDGDFKKHKFGQILDLIPYSNKVIKLNAVCVKCGKDAPFSYRILEENEIKLIGTSDKYEARCFKCF